MIKLGDYVVTPTIFPDGTSQVWKIPEEILNTASMVTWEFENESELSSIIQLSALIAVSTGRQPSLTMPYLIYGRQDKEISNTTTFAKGVIISMLLKHYNKIITLDQHSSDGLYYRANIISAQPNLRDVLIAVKPDVICYPDLGASNRGYDKYFYPVVILDKVRDQLTGEITGLVLLPPRSHISS